MNSVARASTSQSCATNKIGKIFRWMDTWGRKFHFAIKLKWNCEVLVSHDHKKYQGRTNKYELFAFDLDFQTPNLPIPSLCRICWCLSNPIIIYWFWFLESFLMPVVVSCRWTSCHCAFRTQDISREVTWSLPSTSYGRHWQKIPIHHKNPSMDQDLSCLCR